MATKKNTPNIDWDNYEGESDGFENVQQSDLGIPFLYIIQKGSAEVDEDHEDYATKRIDGVKAGCIVNAVTRSIVHMPDGPPMKVVPYFYTTAYVEWKKKGIAGTHTDPRILTQCVRDPETNKDVLPNGNTIVTTKYMFVKLIHDDPDRDQMCIIAFTSTQLKKASAWLKLARSFKGPDDRIKPLFSREYLLTTTGEANEKGNWKGWVIEAGDEMQNLERLEIIKTDLAQVKRETVLLIGTSTEPETVVEREAQDIV